MLLSRKRLVGLMLVAAAALLLLWEPQPLLRLDFQAQDAFSHVAPTTPAPKGAPRTIVALLGERSLAELHRWPWPRRGYAALLARLAQARLVVFDITMPERSTPEDDALLSEAVRAHGRVVLAIYVSPKSHRGDTDSPLQPVYPFEELFDAASGFGVVNVEPDPDGIIRRYPLLWPADGLTLPSLPMAVPVALGWEPRLESVDGGHLLRWTRSAHAADVPAPAPLRLDARYAARFLLPDPQSMTVVECADLLEGKTDPALIKDAIVVIGVSAPGASDLHSIPGGAFLPGSVLVAQGIEALWRGDALAAIPFLPAFTASLLLLCGAAGAALGPRIRRGVGVFLLLCLVWMAAWAALMQAHLLLPLAAPLAATLLVFMAGACYSFFVLEKDWAVRSLPLETVLLAPSQHGTVSGAGRETDFSVALRRMWPKIEAMCGCSLLEPSAPATHESVAPLLAEAEREKTERSMLHIVPGASDKPPRHRMLVPLSSTDKTQHYAVIGWNGSPGAETLKSVAALVVSLASQHAFAAAQAQNHAMLFSTIRAITGAIDAKDPITAGHSERVAALAKNLALWLGYTPEMAEEVFFAGILHDVGKIGVPDAVLGKEGKLTDEEYATMKRHPAAGDTIMRPIGLSPEVAAGILQHHERPDGKGYPEGLAGDAISTTARILKIADVYDALVSERQYKKAWPVEKALALLYEQKDVEFDPHMVDVFIGRMAPQGWRPESKDT